MGKGAHFSVLAGLGAVGVRGTELDLVLLGVVELLHARVRARARLTLGAVGGPVGGNEGADLACVEAQRAALVLGGLVVEETPL